MVILGGGYFNDIPGFQFIGQGNQLTVDFGTGALIADFSVDHVGEINRCRPIRQGFNFTAWRKNVDLILKKITKGANRRSLREAMVSARTAGIKVSGTVILGLGGAEYWEEHIDGTLALLSEAPLTYLSTLQLFLEDTVRQEFAEKFGESFQRQNDRGILLEQARLVGGLDPPEPVIFRSNHASNALALAGNLPRDRDALLRQIDVILKGAPGIRPAYLRGL